MEEETPFSRKPAKYSRDGTEKYYVSDVPVSKEAFTRAIAVYQKYLDCLHAGGSQAECAEKYEAAEEAISEMVKKTPDARPAPRAKSARTTKKARAPKKSAPASKTRATVKCGTDKNGRPYYYVNGKRATKDAYLAAGGRCKAAKK